MGHQPSAADCFALICRALRASTLFAEWPLPSIERLAKMARLEHHKKHTQVLAADRERREVLVVVSGSVEVSRTNADGSRFVGILMRAGDCSGLVRLLPEIRAPYDYVVLEEALLVHAPSDAMIEIMNDEPILWRSVALLLLSRQRDNAVSMQQRVLSDLSTQLAARIVELLAASDISGAGGRGQSLHLSQSKLASMLGKSRQTINKELGKLSAKGLITIDYGKIDVLDLPALEALAASGSSR
ncbi:Crp/Fnr family transcriptional regulator [Paraburkholderia gardini]|uniref:HTH crp-type domain-containing protein n=1 Tax=Paraburkholderia gardini TaxID=2823469 RepID=A0ABM8U9D6_9BURK|nr:Crp/Fnr family transcriptional regulator [Paraburkholderia gardini]CAG4918911.1 hypothetical protein R54767_04555 [Paraburkholderia gardini]